MAKDVVCGMTVDEDTPVAKVEFKGKTYYFCSQQCVEEFKEKPQKYVEKKQNES
ncbi:MAG: YHS domain-containing protein [Calditrichaeota bacterium]|nr:YHS domain-containing protein [Calditrichota bacterium]